MKDKEKLERAAQDALERFNGRGLRMSFVIGKRTRWVAEMLPEPASVAPRLGVSGFDLSPELVERYAEQPVARGEGATQLGAVSDLQPVSWDRDAKHVIVKLQRPMASNEENPPCLVYTRDRNQQWFIPLTERFLRHCRDTGKAYYHATVKDGKLEIGARIVDQDW